MLTHFGIAGEVAHLDTIVGLIDMPALGRLEVKTSVSWIAVQTSIHVAQRDTNPRDSWIASQIFLEKSFETIVTRDPFFKT